LETDAPRPGVTVAARGSNHRTMGERPDFNGLTLLIPGFPVSVTKPIVEGDLRSAVCKKS